MKIIRKVPGQAPEVLSGKMLAVGMKILKAMPESETLNFGGLMLYHGGRNAKSERDLLHPDCIINGRTYWGTVYIAAVGHGGKPTGIKNIDAALEHLFFTARYSLVDREHNTWQCRHCGFLQQLEAGGPYENGWNVCPSCRLSILPPPEE